MIKCPHCAEEIQEDAKICRWCHTDLAANRPAAVPRPSAGAEAAFILGISSVLLFGIFAIPLYPLRVYGMLFLPAAFLAIIFGHLSGHRIRRSVGRITGAKKARTGLILGYGMFPFSFVCLIVVIIRTPYREQPWIDPIDKLRTYATAETTYASTYNAGFSKTLGDLGPPSSYDSPPNSTAAGLVDNILSGGTARGMTAVEDGYKYIYSPGPPVAGKIKSYQIWADPFGYGMSGAKLYYVDQTGIIRSAGKGRAGPYSKPLAQ